MRMSLRLLARIGACALTALALPSCSAAFAQSTTGRPAAENATNCLRQTANASSPGGGRINVYTSDHFNNYRIVVTANNGTGGETPIAMIKGSNTAAGHAPPKITVSKLGNIYVTAQVHGEIAVALHTADKWPQSDPCPSAEPLSSRAKSRDESH